MEPIMHGTETLAKFLLAFCRTPTLDLLGEALLGCQSSSWWQRASSWRDARSIPWGWKTSSLFPGGQSTFGPPTLREFQSSSWLCQGGWGPRSRQAQWLAQDHSVNAETEIILCGRRWGEVSDPVFIRKRTSPRHICCFLPKDMKFQNGLKA